MYTEVTIFRKKKFKIKLYIYLLESFIQQNSETNWIFNHPFCFRGLKWKKKKKEVQSYPTKCHYSLCQDKSTICNQSPKKGK